MTIKTKATILSVSLPENLVREVKKQAKESNVSVSSLAQRALEHFILADQWKDIQKYGYQQSIRNDIRPEDVNRLIAEYRNE